MQVIVKHPVKADNIYPKHESRTKDAERFIRYTEWNVQIEKSGCNQYLVRLVADWPLYHSFVSSYTSTPFATESEARDDANRVWQFVRDEWTGCEVYQNTANEGEKPNWVRLEPSKAQVPGNDYTVRVCPKCSHLNTLVTQMLPYGDSHSCSRDECNYEHYMSIGD